MFNDVSGVFVCSEPPTSNTLGFHQFCLCQISTVRPFTKCDRAAQFDILGYRAFVQLLAERYEYSETYLYIPTGKARLLFACCLLEGVGIERGGAGVKGVGKSTWDS